MMWVVCWPECQLTCDRIPDFSYTAENPARHVPAYPCQKQANKTVDCIVNKLHEGFILMIG